MSSRVRTSYAVLVFLLLGLRREEETKKKSTTKIASSVSARLGDNRFGGRKSVQQLAHNKAGSHRPAARYVKKLARLNLSVILVAIESSTAVLLQYLEGPKESERLSVVYADCCAKLLEDSRAR